MPLASVSNALAVPELVRTLLVADSVLLGLPTKSVAPRPRVIAPRLSVTAWVPLLVRTMSEAPVPSVVEAKVWAVVAAAAVIRSRPLPLPTLASSTGVSWVPTWGAEAPPRMSTEFAVTRLVAALVLKVSWRVLTLLGEPAVTPGAPAMMVVAPV